MTETSLTTIDNMAIMPTMSIEEAIMRRNAIVQFTASIMKDGFDYGKIPGTQKNTLLKPGAEKLTTFFGLLPDFKIVDSVMDWMGKDHDGEPFFYFSYRCILRRGDLAVGAGDGSCNSWEKKYRYRKGGRSCPECGQPVRKSKQGGGWYCWEKTGGCGATWSQGAQAIEGQQAGQIKNDNPADLVNTIQKMAQKRALVAATLIAVNASEFFTQDVEDYADIIEAEYTERPSAPEPVRKTAPAQPVAKPAQAQAEKKSTNGNGEPRPTASMIRGLHAVGTFVFGKGWDAERARQSKALGKESSKDWSIQEYYGVFEPMEVMRKNKLAEVEKQKEDQPELIKDQPGAFAE